MATALLGATAGCTTETGSESETVTTTYGPDDTTQPVTDFPTTVPQDGQGAVRIENTTQYRIDVRIQIYVKDGPESLLDYVLVDPDSARTVSYSVEDTGTHYIVATLPTLGDRDVNWTVDEQWSIESTAEPGMLMITVADEGLSIKTPSQE